MTAMDNFERFYYHNGPRRASMALFLDKGTGSVILATAFARKGDVYTKKVAREILDARLAMFLLDVKLKLMIPQVSRNPGAVFVGVYDGVQSKNEIFGPLTDITIGRTVAYCAILPI